MVTSTWQVVGGGESGGIVVRTAKETSSPQAAGGRLATGALVKELGSDGDRLRYEKLQGAGPVRGWVSKTLSSGKTLLKQSPRDQIWKVVGGADKSGILVRTEQATTSPAVSARLSTGALVLEVELVGDRLCYDRLTGTGPCTGWVSVRVASGDGALLVRTDEDPSDHLDDDLRAFGAICELELPCPDAAAPAVRAGFLELPAPFLIGVATAAYQIEGAANEGGRKPSIWDDFSHKSGLTAFGATGDVACDHYHCYKRDVALMAHLGMKAYRLSISWSRLIPDGVGEVNEEGAAFYSSLIDELLAHGITPWVTLYHWDLPLALEKDFNGWLGPKDRITGAFGRYARVCFERFGDRVKHWFTVNEPYCCAFIGYVAGHHAPGKAPEGVGGAAPEYTCMHNMILAHAEAVRVYRAEFREAQGGAIGAAVNAEWRQPLRPHSTADLLAARRAMAFTLGWFADPVYFGDYAPEMREDLGGVLPRFTDEEKSLLRGSCDFFGCNYYTASYAVSKAVAPGRFTGDLAATPKEDERWEQNLMDMPIVPWGFTKLLRRIQQRYAPPGGIYISENGCPQDGPRSAELDSKVPNALVPRPAPREVTDADGGLSAETFDDGERVRFIRAHLAALHGAREGGADVRGYFCWSLLDNYEWSLGYTKRFGIVRVDYRTQRRTVKSSGRFLAQVAREQGFAAPPKGEEYSGSIF